MKMFINAKKGEDGKEEVGELLVNYRFSCYIYVSSHNLNRLKTIIALCNRMNVFVSVYLAAILLWSK